MALIRRLFEKFVKRESRRARLVLSLADFSAIYAIGDVHGCIGLLRSAYDHILQDMPAMPGRKLVVFLGDYVDRGPDSKAVLEFLCQPSLGDIDHICLCGNHDAEFLRFLHNPKANLSWLGFGGMETLRSYGIDAKHILKSGGGPDALDRTVRQAIPADHVHLLACLPTMLEVGNLVFVHAGVRPGIPLAEQTDQDLMWIRDPFLHDGPKLPLLVVHGHTVSPQPVFGTRRVGIDTGAFATGRLTVLKLSQGKADILQ
jgi:serine/threonine protein phosphatase 1